MMMELQHAAPHLLAAASCCAAILASYLDLIAALCFTLLHIVSNLSKTQEWSDLLVRGDDVKNSGCDSADGKNAAIFEKPCAGRANQRVCEIHYGRHK